MSTQTASSDSPKNIAIYTGMVMLAAVGFGTVPYFARSLTEAGMSASAIAFCRYAITAVVLLPYLNLREAFRTATFWGIAAGAAMGIGWIGYVTALKSAPFPVVSVIYMTYPVFTLVLGWVFFHDRPNRWSYAGAGMILIAALLVATPADGGADVSVSGILMAFLAPLGFAFAINILTQKLVALPPLSRIAPVSIGAVAGLFPLMLAGGVSSALPDSAAHVWLVLGIALVTALVPQLLFVSFAPMIGTARSAMAGSIELPVMFLVGWMAFGVPFTVVQLVAGALVVGAVFVTPARRAGLRDYARAP